ncbi:hypothetical protein [Thermomonas alba]|uniref:hypothetical protein n=1 Tax=Thermomonas alba TaxID=2888525 RepID=UPI001F033BD1|nr:hypothetical protein [Thermomonas alba]
MSAVWRARWQALPRTARTLLLTVAGVALVAAALTALRDPLGRWLWPDPRYDVLRQRAERALRAGRLSASDGSGARELFEAALALQPDQLEAREGLDRVAQAALARAAARLDAGDLAGAQTALQLARELQAPKPQVDALQARLDARQAEDDLGELLARAHRAQADGHLDDGPQAALPLYQQALRQAPRSLRALEGREDALQALLRPAPAALARGDLAQVAELIRRAERFDPGFDALPALHAGLARAVEQRLLQARQQLQRHRPQAAARVCDGLRPVLPAPLPEPCAQTLGDALLHAASRQHKAGRIAQARHLLDLAAAAGVPEDRLQALRQRLHPASAAPPPSSAPLTAHAHAHLQRLLQQAAHAQEHGHWLTPPGESAWDRLRAARALAPNDPDVRAAAAAMRDAARECQARALRDNALARAHTCLDVWRLLDPNDPGLLPAQRRLAERWLAVGDERLRGGDVAGARQALEHARQVDASVPGIAALAQRLQRVRSDLR